MGHDTMKYLTGGVQTAVGLSATMMGAPEIGIPMMTSGIGSMSGSGGQQGGLGGLGSLFGGGNKPSGGGGFAMPGQAGTPSIGQMSGSIPSFINPQDIIGVSTNQAPLPGGAPGGNPLTGLNQASAPALQILQKMMGLGGGQQQQKPSSPPISPAPAPSPPPSPQGGMQGMPKPNPPVPTPQGAPKPSGLPPQIAAYLGLL